MLSKLSLFLNFVKFTLNLSEKNCWFALCGKFTRALLAHQIFYLPHMEFEGSIGKVMRKMKKKIANFHFLGLFMNK
jgi:hypothetical protein